MFRTLIFRGVASRFFFHTKKGSSASCRSPCQCVRNKASQVVFFLRHLSTLPILVEEGFPGTLKRHGFRIFISSVGVQMDDSEILGDSAPIDIQKSSTQGGFLKLKQFLVAGFWGGWKGLDVQAPESICIHLSLFHSYPDSYPCNMIKSWLSWWYSFQWLCSSMFQ